MAKLQVILLYPAFLRVTSSFLIQPGIHSWRSSLAPLKAGSISEWRDLLFDYPGTGNDRRLGTERGAPPRQINILPFSYEDVLLQGETKQLRLYEDRFIKLFANTMEQHCGVVAMGLLSSSGLVKKVSLCEIEAYNRMEGFGIFVTLRAVGRADVLEITQQVPYLQAVCVEVSDSLPPNLELPNLLATNIEESLQKLSKMETRLEQAKRNQKGGNTRKRGLDRAKLEDRFYEAVDDDDDDEDDESNEDDDCVEMDRQQRYQTAYRIALATDTQGYALACTDCSYGKTPQQLTAVSWAGFCTDLVPAAFATYRIRALDCDDLFERLKLATQMLKQREGQLKEELVKAGLQLDDDNDDDDSGGNQGSTGSRKKDKKQ